MNSYKLGFLHSNPNKMVSIVPIMALIKGSEWYIHYKYIERWTATVWNGRKMVLNVLGQFYLNGWGVWRSCCVLVGHSQQRRAAVHRWRVCGGFIGFCSSSIWSTWLNLQWVTRSTFTLIASFIFSQASGFFCVHVQERGFIMSAGFFSTWIILEHFKC